MSKWKFLVPPAAVPLALWMFVALAGPGGVIEVSSDTGSTPAADAGAGAAGVDGGADGADSSADVDGTAAESSGNGNGCEETLLERAQARTELEGHVTDADKPAGDVNGNQNALAKQCGGAFAEGSQAGTTPPADQTATDPGKSEQATGAPTPDGQAQGQGQANADGNGNGAADAPGHNKP